MARQLIDSKNHPVLGILLSSEQMDRIRTAIAEGRRVEIETSQFSDPGGDYSLIFIDGKQVVRIEGY